MHAFNAWQSPNVPAHKWGGGGGPPWGEFNPPATAGVPTACRTHFKLALSNHSWPISTFFRAIRPEVFFPLSFSFPQRPGDHRSPATNLRFLWLVGPSWSIFSPSEARLKNDIEKTSKKVGKSVIWDSQLPSQTVPKSIRKRRPKKHAIFRRCLFEIFFLLSSIS